MAQQAKPVPGKGGSGFRPGAILIALALSLVLLLLFDLISRAHF